MRGSQRTGELFTTLVTSIDAAIRPVDRFMRQVDVEIEAAEGRLALKTPPRRLSLVWSRVCSRPATFFMLVSLAFGSLVVFATPPLRGPDEIAHFLRIYSYARGELLPQTQVDGRKGIFIQHELNSQLQFFRSAGEWFAGARDDGVRYWQIMAAYQDAIDTNGADHPAVFAPFAGTEGYNPVAYIPYIAAGVIGGLFGLNFPDMLLFMRLLGLATFTAVAAYAIAVSPVLKWAFVLIGLLPVSLYNRSVLSADGAALSTAMIITAVCLRAVWQPAAGRVWERSFWMTLCALSKQPQIAFILLELMLFRLRDLPRRWVSVAAVILPSIMLSPLWVWAPAVKSSGPFDTPTRADVWGYPRKTEPRALATISHCRPIVFIWKPAPFERVGPFPHFVLGAA